MYSFHLQFWLELDLPNRSYSVELEAPLQLGGGQLRNALSAALINQ